MLACARTRVLQGITDQRLQETPENWRLVYKALLLLEYMVKHGPMVRPSRQQHTPGTAARTCTHDSSAPIQQRR